VLGVVSIALRQHQKQFCFCMLLLLHLLFVVFGNERYSRLPGLSLPRHWTLERRGSESMVQTPRK
jgi:hypothetical protein